MSRTSSGMQIFPTSWIRAASPSWATCTGDHPAASASRRTMLATRSECSWFGWSLASIERARERIDIKFCKRCKQSARSLSESS